MISDFFNFIYLRLYKDLLNNNFFTDKKDIALSGSCDGFQIFKKKSDNCWAILFLNNNLNPYIREKRKLTNNDDYSGTTITEKILIHFYFH